MRLTRIVPVTYLLTACGGETPAPPTPPTAITAALPTIEERALDALPGDALRGLNATVTVSPGGRILTVPPNAPDDNFALQVMDSTGAVAARLAPRGAGPGEVRGPAFMAFLQDSALVVWDMMAIRLSIFGVGGAFVAAKGFEPSQVPIAVVGDSVDMRTGGPGGNRWERYPLTGNGKRLLLDDADSVLRATFPEPGPAEGRTLPARAYAATNGRFAVGDGATYRILVYSDAGAFLGLIHQERPPRMPDSAMVEEQRRSLRSMPVPQARRDQMLQRFQETPLSLFSALRYDGRGRLWVLGVEDGNAVADIYADTVLLGRLPIPCPGFTGNGWDVHGEWLAVVCAATGADAVSDGTIRLFRIREVP